MKKFITYIALGIVVVIGIGMFLYMGGSSTSRITNTSNPAVTKTVPTTQSAPSAPGAKQIQSPTKTTTYPQAATGEKIFTMAQVAQHSDQNSCYTAINGGVYDLTSFIDIHPGGSGNILSLCGIDGTIAFTNMHGGQSRPESELASLKIGVLAK